MGLMAVQSGREGDQGDIRRSSHRSGGGGSTEGVQEATTRKGTGKEAPRGVSGAGHRAGWIETGTSPGHLAPSTLRTLGRWFHGDWSEEAERPCRQYFLGVTLK